MKPLVSVCIPAYNSGEHIGRTVESILGQTYGDLELVVVDDASTDGTPDVVRAFSDPRLRLVENDTNLGAVGNWNRALHMTGGEFVKLVCGDDILHPSCLERQIAALQANPGASMTASKRDIIDAKGRVLMRRRGLGKLVGNVDGSTAIRAAVRSGTNPFGEPFAVLMRRSAIEKVGDFRALAYVIDLDYWTRLLQVGSLVAIPESLGSFRVHGTSWSRAIGRDQSRQTVALFRELQVDCAAAVSTGDLRRGAIAARLNAAARLVLYRFLGF